MIDKELLKKVITTGLEGTGNFLVDLSVTPDNEIVVEIDSEAGSVDIDACVELSRKIESAFDRDVEDYGLEVGSADLTSPFKVREQYVKNIGEAVELLTTDGRKVRGTLSEVDADGAFAVSVPTKVKAPGEKRPHVEDVVERFTPDKCKYVKIDFK